MSTAFLSSDAPASMIALFCVALAAPLLAAAVALSPPMGARAALLADIQPRGSVLHARQMLYPESCFSLCDPILAVLNDGHPVSGDPPPSQPQPQPNNPSPRPTTANGSPPTVINSPPTVVNSPPTGMPDNPNFPSVSLGGGPTQNAPFGATTTSSSPTSTTSRTTSPALTTSALGASLLPSGFQSNSVPAAGVMGVGVGVQVICAIFSLCVTVALLA
ncbi:hypothetical protein BC826DRAFT_1107613 [Russula brevipes]|nr:hypothetical protein BC826DRAFT_1107613 [Russula brevipes]